MTKTGNRTNEERKVKEVEEISVCERKCKRRKYRFHYNEMFRLIFQVTMNPLRYHKDYSMSYSSKQAKGKRRRATFRFFTTAIIWTSASKAIIQVCLWIRPSGQGRREFNLPVTLSNQLLRHAWKNDRYIAYRNKSITTIEIQRKLPKCVPRNSAVRNIHASNDEIKHELTN
jgi:hypothetical protein